MSCFINIYKNKNICVSVDKKLPKDEDKDRCVSVDEELLEDESVSYLKNGIFSYTNHRYRELLPRLVSFSKNKHMVAITYTGFVVVVSVKTGRLLKKFPILQRDSDPTSMAFCNNSQIALGYRSSECVILCIDTGKSSLIYFKDGVDEGDYEINSIFSSNGITLFVSNDYIKAWYCGEDPTHLSSIDIDEMLGNDNPFLLTTTISMDGRRIYAITYSSLSVYDSFSGKTIESYDLYPSFFHYTPNTDEFCEICCGPIAVSDDNKSLAFSVNDNVFLVSLGKKQKLSDSCSNNKLNILMLDKGEDDETCFLSREVRCIAISLDCKTLVAVHGYSSVRGDSGDSVRVNSVKLYTIGETTCVIIGNYSSLSSILEVTFTVDSNTVISFSDTGVIARFEMNALRKWSLYLYQVMAIPVNVIYTILSMLGFNNNIFKEDFWHCGEKN
jgi:hypothetical protein